MSIQELYTLLKKYRQRRTTPEEEEELSRWYEQFNEEAEQLSAVPEEKLEQLFIRVENKIYRSRSGLSLQRRVIHWAVGVAAMITICATTGYYFFKFESATIQSEDKEIAVITPGHTQAQLTLSDGSTIELDSTTVIKDLPGQLIKTAAIQVLDYSEKKSEVKEEVFNVISVPKGGEYKVILADGTQVWLNSGSSLKYPVTFVKDVRQVDLNGEAYFEVTKSSLPFIVRTFDMDVKVLGTIFNISAYGNDDCVQTTLVDGKVLVSSNHDEQEYLMTPGHAWTYTRSTSQIEMKECDTELYTSWVKGVFKFRDLSLEDIMKKLNRWYGCAVRFENEQLKQLRFSGAAEKDRPVEYLLGMIRTITPVDFEIQGASIIVKNR